MGNITPPSRGRVFAEIPLLRSDHCKLHFPIIPCFPDNKTGLILIFTSKYGTRAYFREMYYFDISKNEVTK